MWLSSDTRAIQSCRDDGAFPPPSDSDGADGASDGQPDRLLDALLVTPGAAAGLLAIGRTRCYELIASGALPSVTLGRSRRIRVSDLEEFVAALHTTASE